MRRLTVLLATAVILIGVFWAAPARAQAVGATDIDISLPSIVILHYFTNVDIDITEAGLVTFLGYASNAVDQGTEAPGPGGFIQDLTISPTAPTGNLGAADLTLQNAWAVRAVGAAGANTQVSIAITDATLTNGAASITITSRSSPMTCPRRWTSIRA